MAQPIIPFNRTGVIGLETIEAAVVGNALVFYFANHPFVSTPFNGVLLVHFTTPAPADATPTMPVFFETRGLSGSRKAVTKAGGGPLTAADIFVPCYSFFFYDFRKGVVEAIAAAPGEEAPANNVKSNLNQR